MNARTKLMGFGAYSKALELFDFVVADMALLAPSGVQSVGRPAACQCGGSKKEYCQFLVIARGSAQETAGRYLRLRHWLPADLPEIRIALCDEIIGILTASILKLRSQLASTK